MLLEGPCAVADAVFLVRVHLAEGDVVAIGDEHRVVAEALVAARRPGEAAVDFAAEHLCPFHLARRAPARRRNGPPGPQGFWTRRAPCCTRSIAKLKSRFGPGPAGRVDTGVAEDRRHHKPGIIAQRNEAACFRAGLGLERGVGLERVAGLLGLRGDRAVGVRQLWRCGAAPSKRRESRAPCPCCGWRSAAFRS